MTHLRVWFNKESKEPIGFFEKRKIETYSGIVVGTYGRLYGHTVVRLDSGEIITLNDWSDIIKTQWVNVGAEIEPKAAR